MSKRQDISFDRGEDVEIRFVIKKKDGTRKDLTGLDLSCQILSILGDIIPLAQADQGDGVEFTDASQGEGTITFDSDVTDALPAGDKAWTVSCVTPGSRDVYIEGLCHIGRARVPTTP